MREVIFQLVGGPWDGQSLSTASRDEANACFAEALYAISGGRKGTRIPLVPPGGRKKTASKSPAPRSHDYEIASRDELVDQLVIVARHIP